MALNGSVAELPPRTLCAGTATLPSVVVLRYPVRIRYVVLDVGGCALITSSGTRREFSGHGEGTLDKAYTNTARRR